VIADLPGSGLASFQNGTIYLDRDAAGRGWFLDSTPTLNEEFVETTPFELSAINPNLIRKTDLLTVLEHEMGDALGISDLDASINDLMSDLLREGVRRGVTPAEIDAVLEHYGLLTY
jgi:large repetitive protein